VAAAHVYREIMGKAIEPMTVAGANAILHDVARAISKVAPIYGAIHEREAQRPLSTSDLMHGAFQRGATVLRTQKALNTDASRAAVRHEAGGSRFDARAHGSGRQHHDRTREVSAGSKGNGVRHRRRRYRFYALTLLFSSIMRKKVSVDGGSSPPANVGHRRG
jgi:hypothetical protein